MRRRLRTEKVTETGVLGVIALVCYSATFAAMLVFGYSVLGLALSALGRDLAALLAPAGL